MLSVVIATRDCERPLVATLAALVAGAAAGIVREVIVADGGSTDQTRDVAEIAGCTVLEADGGIGKQLALGAAQARADWLMFVRPGIVLDASWIGCAGRFMEEATRQDRPERRAAVFRPAPSADAERPTLVEALTLLGAALGRRPTPAQGLVIARVLYDELGGHRAQAADAEADLLRRIGRRRIVMLRSGAVAVRQDGERR